MAASEQAKRQPAPHIEVRNLTMRYGGLLIQRDVNFAVQRGEVFVIMGGSGCGKSTLLRHMIGLMRPARGQIFYDGESFWDAEQEQREQRQRRFGVLFQGGALWSSLTLAENIALPLQLYSSLGAEQIRDIVSYKLALVGLAGCEEYYPAELSGGMRKRAGLARAMALDPEILFFDEPGAGLDPLSSRRLDDLIVQLSATLGATIVVVTHELASIFAIATNSVFLDGESRTVIAMGDPKVLVDTGVAPVRAFLRRGEP